MSHRFLLRDPPPAEAEQYGRLKFHRYQREPQNGRCGGIYLKAWRGKAERPYANYVFPSAASREKWIEDEKQAEDARDAERARRKAEDARQLEKMKARIVLGTILHYSWGYDQTQCEYFQVVEKRGLTVVIRRIGAETVPDSEVFMSDRRRPVPDRFYGEPLRKRIRPYGLSMPHGIANPCKATDAFYCSWYH